MNVVLSYGGNAQLGILEGMNKLVPMLRGQGQTAQVATVRDSVFWTNLILAALVASGIALSSFFVPLAYSKPLQINAVIVLLLLVFYYLFSLLRADNRFGLLSMGVFALSALSTVLVLGCGFLAENHLLGALIGLACAYGLTVFFWQWKGGYRYTLKIDRSAILLSFRMGAPLIVLIVLSTVFVSVDRWVIAARLGATQLGYYALGIMACNLISLIPGSVAGVLYPRMLERFGANSDPASLRGLLINPTRAVATLMAVIVGVAVLVLIFVVRFFLPRYSPSVPILTILIPGAFFYALASIPGVFVIAINKQHWLIGLQGICIVLGLIMSITAVSLGWGIVGVAVSTFIVYGVYGLGYTVFSAHFALKTRIEIVRFLGQVFTPFLAMAFALILGLLIIPTGATFGDEALRTAGRLALMMAVLSLALWRTNRDGKVMAVMREEFNVFLIAARQYKTRNKHNREE
jgi:O-antigen/teichoic acid export membrane protein